MHFSEEVELLNEEMRRVLAFLEWDACRWEERATERIQAATPAATVDSLPVFPDGALDEGLATTGLCTTPGSDPAKTIHPLLNPMEFHPYLYPYFE